MNVYVFYVFLDVKLFCVVHTQFANFLKLLVINELQ